MKTSFISAFFILALGFSASASEKQCTGFANSPDSAGVVLTLKIQSGSITLKSVKGDSFDGTYEANGGKSLAADGKTYIEYEGQDDAYFNQISVDQDLRKAGTTGLIKIRSIGEGWFDVFFNCR